MLPPTPSVQTSLPSPVQRPAQSPSPLNALPMPLPQQEHFDSGGEYFLVLISTTRCCLRILQRCQPRIVLRRRHLLPAAMPRPHSGCMPVRRRGLDYGHRRVERGDRCCSLVFPVLPVLFPLAGTFWCFSSRVCG